MRKRIVLLAVVTLLLLGMGGLSSSFAGEEGGYKQPLQEVFQTEVVYPQEIGGGSDIEEAPHERYFV